MSKVEYKDTLNLPNTAFPMKANLPQKEPNLLAKWEEKDLYQQIRTAQKGKKKFILHMGPPYANGDIHIGHAVTTILKDMIVKFKTLSGFDAPLVPGWDCHGLPIEVNVEKKIGLANVDVAPKAFRDACRDYALSQIALQKASFIRLGIVADWNHPYLTLEKNYEANVVRSIGKILEHGSLHSGAKPVHWCVNCGSALAEAEVEYQNKTSSAVDVCFPVNEIDKFLNIVLKNSPHPISHPAFVIWTTTPWTLPANQAVAVHPELEYVLVKANFGNKIDAICVLKDLLHDCMARFEITDFEVLVTFHGKQVESLLLNHPFYDKTVPLVLGEHVTTEAGTGAVHTAPGHGLEDYAVGMHYGLAIDNPVANNGCFYENTPLVGGLFVFKANDKIIDILKENGNLLHVASLSHSYPHCWRHKTPLIFRATPQWFVSMESQQLRQKTLDAVGKVKWVPSWGQSRMTLMIEGRPDWCISRQRTWGVPLTLVLHKETNALHPQMKEIIAIVADKVQEKGIEAWYELDLNTLPFADMNQYEKGKDVLDVWFESGVSHTSVLKAREDLQFPADIYLEGSDQHRGWFQTSILSSVAMYDMAPYGTVITHGFTVDAQGRKMSKSLGNVIAPEKIVKTLGADVLRLWVSSTDYKNEIHVSDEILNRMADAYRRIRNTMRFLLANLDGFDPSMIVPQTKLIALDAWIIDCVAKLQDEILQHYETYQFHLIYHRLHNFCIVELGSFYLDVIKDRQYTLKSDSLARRSAQTAMYYISHVLTRLMAPILTFTAEEIWENLPGNNTQTVLLSSWLENIPKLKSDSAMGDEFWQQMILVKNNVNKALEMQRSQGIIGSPLQARVLLYADEKLYQNLLSLEDELRFVLITSSAQIKPLNAKSEQAQKSDLEGLWIEVNPSQDPKCARCWHHREDVNQNPDYPEICGRCINNIAEQGEVRHYA